MKKLIFAILVFFSATCFGQTDYIPNDPGNIKIAVNINGAIRSVRMDDLAAPKTVITTLAGLRAYTIVRNPKIDALFVTTDYGGGQWIWNPTSVAADNTGTIIKATAITTGRFERQITNKQINLDWFCGKKGYKYFPAAGTIGAGSNSLSVSGAAFNNNDIGKSIYLTDIVTDSFSTTMVATVQSKMISSTITGVTNSTTVTITGNSTYAHSGAHVQYGYDNTADITNAVTVAASLNYTLTVPSDSFLTGRTVMPSNTHIQFSAGAKFRSTITNTANILFAYQQRNLSVDGGDFDCAGVPGSIYGGISPIEYNGCDNVIADNTYIHDNGAAAMYFTNHCTNVKIRGNKTKKTDTGLGIVGDCSDFEISGNTYGMYGGGGTSEGIAFYGNKPSYRFDIHDNFFLNRRAAGANLFNLHNSRFHHNCVSDCDGAFQLYGYDGQNGQGLFSSDLTVDNNTFTNIKNAGINGCGDNVSIVNNTFINVGFFVMGTLIPSQTANGIPNTADASRTFKNFKFNNNSISSSNPTGTGFYTIIAGNLVSSQINGNTIDSCGPAIRVTGYDSSFEVSRNTVTKSDGTLYLDLANPALPGKVEGNTLDQISFNPTYPLTNGLGIKFLNNTYSGNTTFYPSPVSNVLTFINTYRPDNEYFVDQNATLDGLPESWDNRVITFFSKGNLTIRHAHFPAGALPIVLKSGADINLAQNRSIRLKMVKSANAWIEEGY